MITLPKPWFAPGKSSARLLAAAAVLAVAAWCLAWPQVVAADDVYAISFSTGEMIRYDSTDPAGTRTTLIAAGQLDQPGALTLGPDGNLYIGVGGDGGTVAPTIARYDLPGGTLSTVYTFSAFEVFPGSLAFLGNDLLVGRNPLFSNTGPIVKLTGVIGGPVVPSDYTSGTTLASSPGLALAADGSLYVSDQTYDFGTSTASGPVKRFDASGVFIEEVIADGADGLSGPTGLVVEGSTLYTASIMTGTILETSLGSGTTQGFGDSGAPFGTGVLTSLSAGGLLAGSPAGDGAIYRFGSDGTLLETFSSGLGQVGGIATVSVPEPGTIALAALGLTTAAAMARRLRKRGSR